MEQKKEHAVIDLRVIWKKIRAKRKVYFLVLPITFVLSCLYIICIPRYYTTSLSLAPELATGSSVSGTIGSIASSFGFDLGSMESSDAISPLLYPDLMDDNGFVVDLFQVKVKNVDGSIDCNYYDYLVFHQKNPWWTYVINWFRRLFPKKQDLAGNVAERDAYFLTKLEDDVAELIRSNIKVSVDKKTGVISIQAQDQDPYICRNLADSVKNRLQIFITAYRTNKARIDADHYYKLAMNAKAEYDQVCKEYATYSDSNMDILLQSYKAKKEALENDMQLKYNTYTTIMAQYQAASAKVQERTPAFTLLKGASVPIEPAGPKRMIFVICMTFVVFIVLSLYFIRDLIIKE